MALVCKNGIAVRNAHYGHRFGGTAHHKVEKLECSQKDRDILTEEELDGFTASLPDGCRSIYLGHDVLPSEEQETLFKKNNIAVNIIPDYYYKDLEG